MAIRIYQKQGAVLRSMSIPVEVDKGMITRVLFSGGGITPASGNCSFLTDDKRLQSALEKHSLFNAPDGFVLLSALDDEAKLNSDELSAVAEVSDLASAKKYILANFKGYTQADVSNVDKINALSAKLGVYFPNWKL